METIWIIGGAVALTVVWIAVKMTTAAKRTSRFEAILSHADYHQANALFMEHYEILLTHFRNVKASPFKQAYIDELTESCVAARNRMNELQGYDHGPTARLKIRNEMMSIFMSIMQENSR